LAAERCIAVRLTGIQPAAEFAESAIALLHELDGASAINVMFDWTALSGWDDNDRAARSCRQWHNAAHLIRRMAIVHDRRWNRQAAALAAIMRKSRRDVRSWHAGEYTEAMQWLAHSA